MKRHKFLMSFSAAFGTERVFLDAKGTPRPELFLKDQLHRNRDRYVHWTAVIKLNLDTVLDGSD